MRRNPRLDETPYPINEWDDPVPANSDWNWEFPEAQPHEIEVLIQMALLAQPEVEFTSLVVRRTPDGVCLQGVMQVYDSDIAPDVADIVRQVAGIESVLNQLLIQTVEASTVT